METLHKELAFSTIDDTAEQIRTGKLSPVELTALLLERIERAEPKLNAFVTLTAEAAMSQAQQAERDIQNGHYKGALHGIPIVHKDLYYTKGVRTTASSKVLGDFVPAYSSTVVEKLETAGAIMLGKVQTHEFAAGAFTDSPHFGPCHNPWDLERVPGGSSGGSGAAVSAGLAFMGTGSDTGGSIRIPAACCGIVGMKPTYGRVSRYGIVPLSWSLDHSGPLTRSVKDAALCLNVMAGFDPKDESTADLPVPDYTAGLRQDLKGIKIGVPASYYFDTLEPEVEAAVHNALAAMKSMGAEIVDVELPMIEYASGALMAILLGEIASIHEDWFRSQPDDYGADVRAFIETGQLMSAPRYLKAQKARHLVQKGFLQALSAVDVLVTPTLPLTAPKIGDRSSGLRLADLTSPTDLTGLPTLALPCGFSPEGLPISLQIIGRPFEEAHVLAVGHAYEVNTEWHHRHPEIV